MNFFRKLRNSAPGVVDGQNLRFNVYLINIRDIESLRSRSETELAQLSQKARYEYYPANSILYREGMFEFLFSKG